MPDLRPLPDYIIRKGFFLSGLLLVSTIIMAVWASAVPSTFLLLRRYVDHFQSGAAMVLAATSIGGLWLETILRRFKISI